jgi:hypothetical protein
MHWLDITVAPCVLQCAYCGEKAAFPQAVSFEHEGETFSLHKCTACESLIYDMRGIVAPIAPLIDLRDGEVPREARYTIETGFSSHHVAACALAALPEIPENDLKSYVFVDVGAGLGMGSYLVKTLFGLRTVTIEPSFTGKIAHEMLGLEVHRAYFENLPDHILNELANRPCLLHLNSVVEHLLDPETTLTDMMARARVEVIAAIVPDGAWIDPKASFLSALPFLAPRDHRHLPTEKGLAIFLRRLGFDHVSIEVTPGLLTGIGSRHPIPTPTERTVKLAEQVFLEELKRHPNPLVAGGGASRMLNRAVLNGNGPLTAELARHFPYEAQSASILETVRNGAWDDLPFHLGPTCYWLATVALQNGRFSNGMALLEITKAFADAMARDYPSLAMTSIDYKWAALLMESRARAGHGDMPGAKAALNKILDSKSDSSQGARADYVSQAEANLGVLLERTEPSYLGSNAGAA